MHITKHPWLDRVHHMFVKHGLGNLYYNLPNLRKGFVGSCIQQRLEAEYEQENEAHIQQNEHLNVLKICKDNRSYGMQSYLHRIESPNIRSTYSRIRLNSSKLSKHAYTTSNQQCLKCTKVLDWKHCLLECPINEERKNTFFSNIEKVHVSSCSLRTLPLDSLLRCVMNLDFTNILKSSNDDAIPITLSFVCSTYKAFLSGDWNFTTSIFSNT